MLTTPQVAEILGVSIRRVQAMITAGRLPAVKVGRDWMIEKSDLKKVKNRNKKGGRPRSKK